MKTFRLIWAPVALCALSLAVSCQKKEIEEPLQDPVESQVQVRTFTCIIAGEPDSKVAIDGDGKTTWEVGDEILVHGERIGTYNDKLYSTIVTLTADDISADGKSATITVATDPAGVEGIVPYIHKSSGVQDYSSTIYAACPAGAIDQSVTRCYYHNVFAETNLPLMVAYDHEDAFVFKPVGSVISFTMPSTEDFDSYLFMGNNGESVGYERFTAKTALKIDGSESNYFPYTSSDISNPVSGAKTSISGPVVCDGTTLNQICIPGELRFSAGFKIMFLKDGNIEKYVSNKNNYKLYRGDYLPLGEISSHLKTYVPSHESAIPTEGAIDLSADGSANSYIVYADSDPEAVYKFKAVKGNGTESVGKVNSVEVLWETWNNAETVTEKSVIAAVDYEGDYIYFQMPETSIHAGNALIAARNATGTILWSWHIWVPSTTIATDTYGIYSAPLMDRNLGALVVATADGAIAVESFGLTYQWGRKDPFVGADVLGTDSQNATVCGVSVSVTEGSGDADESKITLEQSIQNPTLLGHAKNSDWILPSDNSLWKNSRKTIYDPCPPGYRVPARDKTQPWHSGDLSTVTGWAEDTYWFTLGNPAAVFPFAGYRDDYSPSTVTHAYDRAAYWTSYASSTVGETEEPGGQAYYVNVRKGVAHKLVEVGKSRAGSVRCVAESTE